MTLKCRLLLLILEILKKNCIKNEWRQTLTKNCFEAHRVAVLIVTRTARV